MSEQQVNSRERVAYLKDAFLANKIVEGLFIDSVQEDVDYAGTVYTFTFADGSKEVHSLAWKK